MIVMCLLVEQKGKQIIKYNLNLLYEAFCFMKIFKKVSKIGPKYLVLV